MHVRLGIDVACRAAHRASLADDTGRLLWSGRKFFTRVADLEQLWAQVPEGAQVTVVLEPTRNAWVALAAWLQARGATVLLVPPEQSADLRDYYSKHTKTDRLDSRILARLPLLHPDGDLIALDNLGPAQPLKRAVRRRASLLDQHRRCCQRIDAMLELLGPGLNAELGNGAYGKTALAVIERYGDPRALRRAGKNRLTALLVRHSRGAWREDRAVALLAAADEAIRLWQGGGLDFAELAEDLAGEARQARWLDEQIATLDERIEGLYHDVDPAGVIASAPGVGITLAAAIVGRTGDLNRFASLAGVRAFTGLVPKVDQSGNVERHGPPTKKGDPGLRQALYLAADHARKVDPTLAARYHRLVVDQRKHHVSATCHVAAVLVTRIAACWRNGERYVLRDLDGNEIDATQGRRICAEHYAIPADVRTRRRTPRTAQRHKQRTDRREKESRSAPTLGPSNTKATTTIHP